MTHNKKTTRGLCRFCKHELEEEGKWIVCRICKLKTKKNSTDTCPHKNREYDKKRAELVCRDCGLILWEAYPYVAGIKINFTDFKFEEEESDGGNRRTIQGENRKMEKKTRRRPTSL
jgi:transcription initiation factor TFIIIB Brf1 subunit/transcription initiation factor TFIIB